MPVYCPRSGCEWCELVKTEKRGVAIGRVCIKPSVTFRLVGTGGMVQCEQFEQRRPPPGVASRPGDGRPG